MDRKIHENKNVSIYIPISEKSKAFGLTVTKIAIKQYLVSEMIKYENTHFVDNLSSNLWFTPISQDYFQLFYIQKGKAFIKSYDFQGYLKSGYFIVFPPNEKFSIEPDLNDDYEQYSFSFTGFLPRMWKENKLMLDIIAPMPVDPSLIVSDFSKLIDVAGREKDNFQVLLSSMIVFNLSRYFQSSFDFFDNDDKANSSLEKIKIYFRDNLYEQFNIEDMCDSMEMNYYQLRNYFNQETGMSPYQYLIDMKIQKAIEFLETTDFSIKEISYKLAFDSQYYFSRLFKKKTGVSPSKWKKSK